MVAEKLEIGPSVAHYGAQERFQRVLDREALEAVGQLREPLRPLSHSLDRLTPWYRFGALVRDADRRIR